MLAERGLGSVHGTSGFNSGVDLPQPCFVEGRLTPLMALPVSAEVNLVRGKPDFQDPTQIQSIVAS